MTQQRHKYQGKPVLGDHPAVVYVIAPSEEGPCKIGYSNNLQNRLSGLQTGCWEPLSIFSFRIGIFETGGADRLSFGKAINAGSKALERAAHRALTACELRLQGEWFDVNVQEAVAVLEKCARNEGLRSVSYADIAGAQIREGSDGTAALARHKLMKALGAPALYVSDYQPFSVDRIA